MKKMIAFCGIICTDCPAFIATQKNDDEERKKVAESWSTEKEILKPGDINCDGCLAVGERLIKFCEVCEVRRCGFEKNVENCAYCDEYPCEKLDKLMEYIQTPEAKVTLEEIRRSL
ncbi:DUF3795 domain-containing protein [candidate division KSB1 bacterium]|nr:DUF3795 domain-containing protein [candidate division KSB1 bacterium]